MARQDIAGLLTGMPQQQRPNPNMSSAEWRLAFGQQQSDNMARGLQGAVGGLMGTGMAGAASPQEQIQIADLKAQERIGKLATSQDPAELRQAAQLLQQRGKPAEAARALAQAKTIEEQAIKAESAGLRASSMSQALKTAGHEDLAKQVELGDVDAYKRGLELISPEKGKTSIEDMVDPATGVTHKVLLSSEGVVLRTVGVSKMPTLKSVDLPNGQIVWENEATGTRGKPQDTPEAAAQERGRVDKLYSDLAAVDNVLVTVSEAKKLAEDESMTTGVFYNLASMPFATDARTLQTKITTLQSTLAFDRLQKMRDESKTGGALGQVSNIELQLLQSALTALDPIVGEEEFTKQLDKVQKHYTNFKKALLGEPIDIDWSRPEYKGKTTVVDGIRYMADPADPTKVFAIGKEE